MLAGAGGIDMVMLVVAADDLHGPQVLVGVEPGGEHQHVHHVPRLLASVVDGHHCVGFDAGDQAVGQRGGGRTAFTVAEESPAVLVTSGDVKRVPLGNGALAADHGDGPGLHVERDLGLECCLPVAARPHDEAIDALHRVGFEAERFGVGDEPRTLTNEQLADLLRDFL